MSDKRAVITGIEAYLPEYILTNDELSTMVDTSDEWIMSRVGIKERRILKEDGLGTSYMGEKAVKKLLEATGTRPEEVDLLICATVSPDMLFPATANIISDKVGILNAWGFDMNAGCCGFIYSFETVRRFVETGLYKKAVLVCGERLSCMTDYTDRKTCPLFGDDGGHGNGFSGFYDACRRRGTELSVSESGWLALSSYGRNVAGTASLYPSGRADGI